MCNSLRDFNGITHKMSGVFDAEAEMTAIRHGPTYVSATPTDKNPLFTSSIRAHEYHYSEVYVKDGASFGYELDRGAGINKAKDGLVYKSSLGAYMHQHALSNSDWASGFVSLCK